MPLFQRKDIGTSPSVLPFLPLETPNSFAEQKIKQKSHIYHSYLPQGRSWLPSKAKKKKKLSKDKLWRRTLLGVNLEYFLTSSGGSNSRLFSPNFQNPGSVGNNSQITHGYRNHVDFAFHCLLEK